MHDSHEEFNDRIELENSDVNEYNKKEDSPALNLKSPNVNQKETKSTEAEKLHDLPSQDLHSIIDIDEADSKNQIQFSELDENSESILYDSRDLIERIY